MYHMIRNKEGVIVGTIAAQAMPNLLRLAEQNGRSLSVNKSRTHYVCTADDGFAFGHHEVAQVIIRKDYTIDCAPRLS